MRFGLPQPLERPTPEKIIREVPMEMDLDFPNLHQPMQPQAQQQMQKPGGLAGILPQLLNVAAAFSGNPAYAQGLQALASMVTPAPQPVPQQPPPQPRMSNQKVKMRRKRMQQAQQREQAESSTPRYIKQEPPTPKKPINDEPLPTEERTEGDFSFGLDGSHEQIDPFGHTDEQEHFDDNNMFAEFEEEDHGGEENFDMFGEGQEPDVPEGFPDLTGMSAEEMKETVVNWVQADPANRKQAVLDMLPELSTLIM